MIGKKIVIAKGVNLRGEAATKREKFTTRGSQSRDLESENHQQERKVTR
jgi:hypothetical protein